MKNKLKEYKYLGLLIILFLLFFVIKLPYNIELPGGILNIDSKIESDIKVKTSGTLNMAYVSEIRATIPTYLISKLNNNWDLIKMEESISSNETIEEANYRNTMLLKEANDIATIVAYEKAGRKIEIKNKKMYITYINPSAQTDLKIKDQILKVDYKIINNLEEIATIINNHNVNDTILVETDNGIKKSKIIEIDGKKVIGVLITYDYDFDNEIKFKFTDKESGPSGGMMMTLAIYNYLTNDSLTKNRKIVGTGTIDINGNVGEISGIKYKLKGAIKNKADIFIVSEENYDEAIKLKEKNKYNIKIISVKTIDEAIKYLKE